MNFVENFEELLVAFSNQGVEFMLAGGFAVNFHGYNRSTNDLDIWVKPIDGNKTKVISALSKMGYDSMVLQPLSSLEFTKPFSFKVGMEPIDVDIFNHITGVPYEAAEKNKIEYRWSDNVVVYFISVRDLIVNKMLTGRSKDKLDVEELQKIGLLKKKNE